VEEETVEEAVPEGQFRPKKARTKKKRHEKFLQGVR
jgi:hypothetical protein